MCWTWSKSCDSCIEQMWHGRRDPIDALERELDDGDGDGDEEAEPPDAYEDGEDALSVAESDGDVAVIGCSRWRWSMVR